MMSETTTTVRFPGRCSPQMCADDESRRYALGGVRVHSARDKTVWCTATDGRKLVAIEAEGATDQPRIVPLSVLPKKTPVKGLAIERNGQWEAGNKFVPLDNEPEGRYPDASLVLPARRSGEGGEVLALSLNATYLADLAAALAPGDGRVTLLISLSDSDTTSEQDETDAAVAVEGAIAVIPLEPQDHEALGVLMPCTSGRSAVNRYNQALSRYVSEYQQ